GGGGARPAGRRRGCGGELGVERGRGGGRELREGGGRIRRIAAPGQQLDDLRQEVAESRDRGLRERSALKVRLQEVRQLGSLVHTADGADRCDQVRPHAG